VNSLLLTGFHLGDLLVDPVKGRVTGKEGSVHLPPKAMETLLVLASSPGTLVTRDALLEEVWGKDHSSQKALSHAIGEIRHALNDHSDSPQFIQTLPKRGYRLVAEVEPATAHTASVVLGDTSSIGGGNDSLLKNLNQRGVLETAITYLVLGWLLIQVADIVFSQLLLPAWMGTFVTVLVIAGFPIAILLSWFLEIREGRAIPHELAPRDSFKRRFSRTYMSIIGALVLATIIVFIYDHSVGLPQAPTTEIVASANLPPVLDNSIAVLPFLNVDGSDDTQVFSNGLTDDLITRLSRVPGLLVSSRGDAFTLSPNTESQRVRERLRVAHYLEGSVQIAENQLRIIVQMIDSATGFHVMSRRFDRDREDFFDIRNEITELTVANIQVSLPADIQAPTGPRTDDPSLDAYVLYRRGVDASHAPISIGSIQSSLAWFDAVLAIDPDYAAAHAGKCQVSVEAYPETDDTTYIGQAQMSCARALDLNPNLDIVHTALGKLYTETGRYADAEAAFLEALRINPNSVAALTGIGGTYLLQTRPDEAEARFRQAIGLHPGDWSAYNSLGKFLFYSGRYAEAADEYLKVVALDNTNILGFSNLGTAYLFAGEFEAAASALGSAIEIEPRANTYSSLGLMHYYLGRKDEAIEYHRMAVGLAPTDYLNWSNLGDALWYAGKPDEARQAFETAEELVTGAMAVNPNEPNYLMDLAWISAMLGRPEEALSLITRALEQSPEDPFAHYINGLILLRHGKSDDAIAALKLAAESGYSLKMLAAEPHLASLRDHRDFEAILQESLK
jgi:tetratricopeptide (TPR) repeat protein/TolB-like protein/DNA-binding winged helix-turn-helix (wHTH) protein